MQILLEINWKSRRKYMKEPSEQYKLLSEGRIPSVSYSVQTL
jgi:hypothetical protein